MKKSYVAVAIAILMLISTMLETTAYAAGAPAIPNPMVLKEETNILGAGWATIDPANCYDPGSGELLSQMYDTLVSFNGEHLDQYMPGLATIWTVTNVTRTTSPDGLPLYFQYDFKIRTGVHFWDGNLLTPQDIEYCMERILVQSFPAGPAWMFWQPLLNGQDNQDGTVTISGQIYNMSVTSDISMVGLMIDHAIESNATDVWFNIAFPGVFEPFLQILAQPCSGIYEESWSAGLNLTSNWNGTWGSDHTAWINCFEAKVDYGRSPWDVSQEQIAMGTGPFTLTMLTLNSWQVDRNVNYWGGWPVSWPSGAGAHPAGYVNTFIWESVPNVFGNAVTDFLDGACDIVEVPKENESQLLGQPGVRCVSSLPTLQVDSVCFQFNIPVRNGTINPPGIFTEGALPSDFFGNSVWGLDVRKAFAELFNYTSYQEALYQGDTVIPATTIIQGLPYYDPNVTGYSFNVTDAVRLLQLVPGLWDNGFTLPLPYNKFGIPSLAAFETSIKPVVESLNPKFHVSLVYAGNPYYVPPMALESWFVDYPDPNDFANPFYYSGGLIAKQFGYSDPVMDNLINQAVAAPDGPARQAIYTQIQQLAIADCPSFPIAQPIERHFERDWVCGWFYNPAYSGVHAYNLWKWYYQPQYGSSTYMTNPPEPVDVNYDGIVNIIDVAIVATSFGASYGPPIGPRWVFRADINNDRIINIIDIAAVAANFGKSSPLWIPPMVIMRNGFTEIG